jgi:iron complex transport system substrate-binding protein
MVRLPLIALVILLASCRAPAPEEDRTGIISMVPSATEILFAIGAGDSLVGRSDYCTHPPEAASLPSYGGFLNPSTERIVASGAEAIVLVYTHGKLIEACRSAGMRVVTVKTNNLTDMDEAIATLGDLTGRKSEAEALERRIHAGIEEAAASVPGGSSPRVVVVVDRAPDALKRVFVAGPGSLLDDLLTRTGARNAFSDASRMYPMVSLETILTREPDVIVDLRPLARSERESKSKAEALWKGSSILAPSGPVGAVHVLETTDFTVYGPRIVDAARELARIVHGEAR